MGTGVPRSINKTNLIELEEGKGICPLMLIVDNIISALIRVNKEII